jgi:hypothetical protein
VVGNEEKKEEDIYSSFWMTYKELVDKGVTSCCRTKITPSSQGIWLDL